MKITKLQFATLQLLNEVKCFYVRKLHQQLIDCGLANVNRKITSGTTVCYYAGVKVTKLGKQILKAAEDAALKAANAEFSCYMRNFS